MCWIGKDRVSGNSLAVRPVCSTGRENVWIHILWLWMEMAWGRDVDWPLESRYCEHGAGVICRQSEWEWTWKMGVFVHKIISGPEEAYYDSTIDSSSGQIQWLVFVLMMYSKDPYLSEYMWRLLDHYESWSCDHLLPGRSLHSSHHFPRHA